MLATLPAFSSFSVFDIDEAKHFYGDVLGLSTSVARGMLTLTLGSGAHVLVYPKPNHEPATHTVLMFPTDNIAATVEWARSRGVVFEMLDGVGDDGIMPANEWGPANAWFRDPSGNWLSIVGDTAADTNARG
jgi:catechol 2,3-dioxygenase-like lactoylglutathione lyase family enzyme